MAALLGALGMNERYPGWSIDRHVGREHVREQRGGRLRADSVGGDGTGCHGRQLDRASRGLSSGTSAKSARLRA